MTKGTIGENAQELGERVRDALKESDAGLALVRLLDNDIVVVQSLERADEEE